MRKRRERERDERERERDGKIWSAERSKKVYILVKKHLEKQKKIKRSR